MVVSTDPGTGARERMLGQVTEICAEFARSAAEVDEAGVFPAAQVRRLRETGLLGLLVPPAHGGPGFGVPDMVEVALRLGAACTSTAMIWAMHCQQVATLVRHGGPALRARVLPAVAAGDCLIASITTESGKGGHLLSALASLEPAGDDAPGSGLDLVRDAPVVTGGMDADGYLVTMRTTPESPPTDVSLAYVAREQAEIEARSGWETLGMRGTASAGLRLSARIPEDQLVGGPGGFRDAAVATLIPVGHLAWSAVWLGAAQGALRYYVGVLRDPGQRGAQAGSDLAAHHLARVRLRLDTVSAYLWQCVREYQALGDAPPERYGDVAFQIRINNLKVLASEDAFEAVNDLIGVAGLRHGYLRTRGNPLERAFRDLRAASLMYANDRLLVANGKLALLDREAGLAGGPEPAPAGPLFGGAGRPSGKKDPA